tara:strand:+ start:559 stop:5349 length:4791 start_codon:yes stop_codon:yes gene_type:complete
LADNANFIFAEGPLLGTDTLFSSDLASNFTPEIVPEKEAYGRAFLVSMLGPEDNVGDNIIPVAEANTINQQSEEERAILDGMIQEDLLIAKAAGTDVLLNTPSLQTMDLLEEYYQNVITSNPDLVKEAGKVTTDRSDLNKSVRFARQEAEAWFNLKKNIASEQAAFDAFIDNDSLLGKTNSWLNFVFKNTLPVAETTGLRKIFNNFNPTGAKDYFDPTNIDPLNTGYAGVGETLMLGQQLDALTQSIIDAKPSVKTQMITKLFDIVQDNPNVFPYKTLFNWKSKDGVNKKLQMNELLHEINKGNVEGIDFDKHFADFRGLLGAIPIGGVLAKALKGSKWAKAGAATAKATRDKAARDANLPEVRLNTVWVHEETPQLKLKGKKAPKQLTYEDPTSTKTEVPNPYIFNGRNLDSTLDMLDASDPLVASKLFTSLDRQVVEMYGLRAEDVVSRFMPVPKGFSTSGMSEAALSYLKGTGAALESRLSTINPSFHITPNEKDVAVDMVKARLASKTGLKLFTGKTVVEHNNNGFIIESMYGKDEIGGFTTLSEVKSGLAHVNEPIENVEIIAVNPISNNFEIVSVNALKDTREIAGDFYIRVKSPYLWTSDSVVDFSTGNIGGQAYTPVVGNAFTSNQFTFDPFLVMSATRSADLVPTIAKHLNPFVKPFLKSSKPTKIKVTDMLKQGDTEGKVFTKNEFKGSQEDYDIYLGVRKFFDVVHDVRNEAVRKHLVSQNMRWITDEGSNFNSIGKPIDALPADIPHVWNVATKSFNVVRSTAIQQYIKNGGKFVKLWKAHSNKGNQYDYAIVGTNTKLTELPQSILQYQEGYIPRMYKEPYFIHTEMTTKINGRKVTKKTTLGTTEGKLAAERVVESFNKDIRNAGTVVSASRDVDRLVNTIPEPSTTSLFWEKRGDPLTNLETGILSRIESPIAAVHSTTKALSATMGMGDYLGNMTQRYINAYGPKLSNPGVFSEPSKTLLSELDNGDTAKAMFNEITWLRSVNLDQDTVYKSFIDGVVKLMNSKGLSTYTNKGEAVANLIDQNLYGLSPTNGLRGATFMMFVGSSVLRQLMQNTATVLFTGLTDPLKATRAVGDSATMISAIVTRSLQGPLAEGHEQLIKALGKSLGVSPKEAKVIMEDFVESGLISTTDAHTMFASGLLDASDEIERLATTVALSAPRAVGWVLKNAKKAGFDAGEIINLTLHWNLSRRQFLEERGLPNNAKLSQSDKDQIASMARITSGNQNKTGATTATRLAPLGMNLLNFPISMTMKLFHNDAVTKGLKGVNKVDARIKYAVLGTAVFGTAMWSNAMDIYETATGFTIPQPLKEVLASSLLDSTINSILETITGEESDLLFSKSIFPADIFGVLSEAVHTLEGGLFEALLGASSSAGGDVIDTIRLAKSTMFSPILSTPEKTIMILESAPNLLKGYSDASKVYWATQTGYFLNKKGEPIVKATLPRLLGKLVGVNTKLEEALYSKQRMEASFKKKEQAFVDDTVKMFISMTKLGLTENAYNEMSAFTKGAFPNWDAVLVNNLSLKVAKKYQKYMSALSAEDKLLMRNGKSSEYRMRVLESTASDPRFPKDLREKAETLLKSLRGDE